MKDFFSSLKYAAVLFGLKAKNQAKISRLKFQSLKVKKRFGVDYLTLVGENASVEDLKDCLKTALDEVADLQEEIDGLLQEIVGEEQRVSTVMARVPSSDESPKQDKRKSKPKGSRKSRDDILNGDSNDNYGDDGGCDIDENSETSDEQSHNTRGSEAKKKSEETSAVKKKKKKSKNKRK
eukprot:jgi/Psemu1/305455/fgenesh1_kg.199_\